jgi:hypothetical protein
MEEVPIDLPISVFEWRWRRPLALPHARKDVLFVPCIASIVGGVKLEHALPVNSHSFNTLTQIHEHTETRTLSSLGQKYSCNLRSLDFSKQVLHKSKVVFSYTIATIPWWVVSPPEFAMNSTSVHSAWHCKFPQLDAQSCWKWLLTALSGAEKRRKRVTRPGLYEHEPISPIHLSWESSFKLFIHCEKHPQNYYKLLKTNGDEGPWASRSRLT